MRIVGCIVLLLVGAFASGAGIKLTYLLTTSSSGMLCIPQFPCIFDGIAFTIAGLVTVIAGIKAIK